MDVLTTINAALLSVRTATEIAKIVKDAGSIFEEAEFKLKMAELLTALAESQSALAESSMAITEQQKEIGRLNSLLKFSGNLKRYNNAYFELNEEGDLSGDPYCQHCWESKILPIHLNYVSRSESICPACKNTFNAGMVRLPT